MELVRILEGLTPEKKKNTQNPSRIIANNV